MKRLNLIMCCVAALLFVSACGERDDRTSEEVVAEKFREYMDEHNAIDQDNANRVIEKAKQDREVSGHVTNSTVIEAATVFELAAGSNSLTGDQRRLLIGIVKSGSDRDPSLLRHYDSVLQAEESRRKRYER